MRCGRAEMDTQTIKHKKGVCAILLDCFLVQMMAIATTSNRRETTIPFIQCVRTCVSLLCVMLSDSNVKRKYCKLLSFSILSWVLVNCNFRMNAPGTSMSDDSDVAERSKSYSDNFCTGDFIN